MSKIIDKAIILRDIKESDLQIFFNHQKDPEANFMAAFTSKDPESWNVFLKHWNKIMADETVTIKTIVIKKKVVGHVATFVLFGEREVTYWIDKEYWGRGIATLALIKFLVIIKIRPLFARAAKDNIGSMRVLEKCGFIKHGDDKYFANARGKEIEESIFKLNS